MRNWLSVVSNDPDDAYALGDNISTRAVLFYVDDGLIGSTNPEWLQESFHVLVDLFARVGLLTNTDKTKVMICQPGFLRTRVSDYAYKRSLTGQGLSYREAKRRRVPSRGRISIAR